MSTRAHHREVNLSNIYHQTNLLYHQLPVRQKQSISLEWQDYSSRSPSSMLWQNHWAAIGSREYPVYPVNCIGMYFMSDYTNGDRYDDRAYTLYRPRAVWYSQLCILIDRWQPSRTGRVCTDGSWQSMACQVADRALSINGHKQQRDTIAGDSQRGFIWVLSVQYSHCDRQLLTDCHLSPGQSVLTLRSWLLYVLTETVWQRPTWLLISISKHCPRDGFSFLPFSPFFSPIFSPFVLFIFIFISLPVGFLFSCKNPHLTKLSNCLQTHPVAFHNPAISRLCPRRSSEISLAHQKLFRAAVIALFPCTHCFLPSRKGAIICVCPTPNYLLHMPCEFELFGPEPGGYSPSCRHRIELVIF